MKTHDAGLQTKQTASFGVWFGMHQRLSFSLVYKSLQGRKNLRGPKKPNRICPSWEHWEKTLGRGHEQMNQMCLENSRESSTGRDREGESWRRYLRSGKILGASISPGKWTTDLLLSHPLSATIFECVLPVSVYLFTNFNKADPYII